MLSRSSFVPANVPFETRLKAVLITEIVSASIHLCWFSFLVRPTHDVSIETEGRKRRDENGDADGRQGGGVIAWQGGRQGWNRAILRGGRPGENVPVTRIRRARGHNLWTSSPGNALGARIPVLRSAQRLSLSLSLFLLLHFFSSDLSVSVLLTVLMRSEDPCIEGALFCLKTQKWDNFVHYQFKKIASPVSR